jgi:hypothetical protein|tara:strand:- start:2780 stop:3085 length:306 start_codon:yes stop_codon:yes gene_type:complete
VGDVKKPYKKSNSNYRGLSFEYPIMTRQEDLINAWCVNNNVRISPVPTSSDQYPNRWRIEIRLGAYKKGEKSHLSPSEYTYKDIHQEIKRMQKYYYDKHKK